MKLNLTESEVVDAILAAAEKKAEAPAPFSIAGSAAGLAAQIQGATSTVAEIRATRAKLRDAYAADPGGIAARLLPSLDGLFSAIKAVTS